MMSDIIIVAFVVSGIVGLKSRLLGVFIGSILAIILYFIFNSFEILSFLLNLLAGITASLLGALIIPWFLSGFKGGKRHSGPSIIGGFGRGDTAHRGSGIILSDEERDGIKKQK